MATLYIVATPIGNLEDITLRAIRILQEVDLILCEDTRVTGKLLQKYDIDTPRDSYHAHSQKSKVDKVIKLLEEGKDIALVSDAGTPTISDPGVLLVQQVKEKFEDEVAVIPIPGASALVAALSSSGISSAEFTFLGFLPHKKGRETLFKEIAETNRTVVFYESTHRIMKTLESLEEHLDDGRKVTIARELTKIHEEFLSGTPEELKKILTEDPQKQKGEWCYAPGDQYIFLNEGLKKVHIRDDKVKNKRVRCPKCGRRMMAWLKVDHWDDYIAFTLPYHKIK